MKADTICCYCISKHVTKSSSKAVSQHLHRARPTACEVGVFFERGIH